MVVLPRWLPLLVAAVPFALASSNLDADRPELILPMQRGMHVDFEKLRETLRARPLKGNPGDHPADIHPHDIPVCPPAFPCAEGCVHDGACFRQPIPHDSYSQLCCLVGCSANKDAPLCPVGRCGGGCLCREEIWTKLNVLLINDALGELAEKAGETRGKAES